MKIVAKTLYGLEEVLSNELISLGASDVKPANRAVLFRGNKQLLYKVNYCSRSALSFLMPVAEFRIRSREDLYRESSRVEWDLYMDKNTDFSVVPVVSSSHFDHSGYAGLVLKDAIADYFRKKTGKRPSVNTNDPAVLVNLHISHDNVNISLDSSVIPLYKRGYRTEQAVAPLNESLAAGIILKSGWNASSSFLDPMCGSGTFPIEAGLIACNIAPGKFRKSFGFQKWKDYDEDLFIKVKNECNGAERPSPVKIYAGDILEDAIRKSEANIRNAGLTDVISLKIADFRDQKSMDNNGHLFLNPPYGLRIKPDELNELYNMIGSVLKHNFPGNTAWLITSNKDALKHVGLKPKEKYTLFNGALESLLLKYELYQGSRKEKFTEL